MKNIFKWVYLIGLLVAIVAALFTFSAVWLNWILIIVGILVGIFFFDSNDVVNLGIRYLVLVAVTSVLNNLDVIGPYLTSIFAAVAAFLGPIVLTVLVVWFIKKYFFGKKK